MNRRRFLKSSLLWVPVAPAIVRAAVIPSQRRAASVRRSSTPVDLLTGIVSYWKMDETNTGGSGVDRADSTATGNTMTDNGATLSDSTIKILGKSVILHAVDGSKYLSHASNASLQTGDIQFFFSTWVYPLSLAADCYFINKWDTSGSFREYALLFTLSVNRLRFIVSPDGTSTGTGTATADNFGNVPTSQWLHVVAWHDSVANVVGIAVNGGTPNTTSYSSGVNAGSTTFRLGCGPSIGAPYYGNMDETGFWKSRVPDSSVIAALYNGGAGVTYPFS